jgi:predicted metal-binding protein
LVEYCKSNACGYYNTSWTCPPACGTIDEQREKILSYKEVLVFTTKHELEDSFDYEGMNRGRDIHTALTHEIKKAIGDAPVYGTGNCSVCAERDKRADACLNICSYPAPCPYPDKKIGSIEAAGINVTELSKAAGLTYNNGADTVTYFSMVLL